MYRINLMLGSLLPALWLVAGGDCLLDPAARGPACRCIASAFQGSASRATPDADQGLPAASFRQAGRRAWIQPGADGFSPFLCPESQSWAFAPAARIEPGCGQITDLAACWQFLWRAAGEPRAPSLAS
jgi:hypothetical protein